MLLRGSFKNGCESIKDDKNTQKMLKMCIRAQHTSLQTVCLPTHDLLSGCRVYLTWHLHMGPFSVSSQVCWQPPLPWLQVTAGSTTRNRKTLNQCDILKPTVVHVTRWACGVKPASCRWARTDAASLVPGQLEPWTTLAGHTPFGCLFADVGAAVLLIHTVEALWDRRRERGTQWSSPTVTDRQHTKAHILRD